MNLIQAIREVLREMGTGQKTELVSSNLPPVFQVPANAQAVATQSDQSVAVGELPEEIRKLPVLPQVPAHVLNEALEANQDVVWRYLYKVMERAVKSELQEVNLWRVDGTKLVLYLRNDQFAGCLERMSEYYIKTEQYEYVPFCYELLDKIKVNDVIRESR